MPFSSSKRNQRMHAENLFPFSVRTELFKPVLILLLTSLFSSQQLVLQIALSQKNHFTLPLNHRDLNLFDTDGVYHISNPS